VTATTAGTPQRADGVIRPFEPRCDHRLEADTVASVIPDSPSEQAANYRSEPADRNTARNSGRTSRGGTGWFSYDMAVDPAVPMAQIAGRGSRAA